MQNFYTSENSIQSHVSCELCYVSSCILFIRCANNVYLSICTSVLKNIISSSTLYNSTFQTELIKEWAKCLASSSKQPTKIHIIMEHFSIDMQTILDTYTSSDTSDDEAFEQLVDSYKNDFGTEGHDLHPYRELLQFCRSTTKTMEPVPCNVHIHGGFIPRNHAARLNKECPDTQSKQLFFKEMSEKGYLPKEGDAMYSSLFEDSSSYKLRGSPEHELLIQSLMNGTDLYSPIEESSNNNEDDNVDQQEERPISKLYQAQLLKDQAMGYRIASLMLDHYQANDKSLSSDRYIVIAGYGHLKHYLGVPDCVNGYLQQEAVLNNSNEQRRAAAMELLLSISRRPISTGANNTHQRKFGGKGSALIGCQMMYEAYLEDSYPPMADLVNGDDEDDDGNEEEDDDEDDDAAEQTKRKLLNDLYLQHPKLLDKYILKSQEISGPLLNYTDGIAGFEQPCADYLFVYDEDDENIISDADIEESNIINNNESKCPFKKDTANIDAKQETAHAYERVGKTAGTKGNVARARAIMSQIGYTEEDMNYIGSDDLYNFQGVANPHLVAKIQHGEAVLDIGSGLGIDSFLAMRDCGADTEDDNNGSSFVVGLDLAHSEVNHATKRATERGYRVPDKIQFIKGDIEKIDKEFPKFLMNKFDRCISNGAFCLVPDKHKAFSNVYKALKSGGRMAISTTTIVSDTLDPSFEWPVCSYQCVRVLASRM